MTTTTNDDDLEKLHAAAADALRAYHEAARSRIDPAQAHQLAVLDGYMNGVRDAFDVAAPRTTVYGGESFNVEAI